MGTKGKSLKGEKGPRAGLARRVRRPRPWESTPLVGDEVPPSEEPLPEDVLQAIAELGGACSEISISRRDARRKFAYLDRVPADEFSLDWLKETYGGGEYLARFIDPQKRFLGSKTFTIDGRPKEPPVAGADDTGGELREVLQSVRGLVDSHRDAQAKETSTLLFEMMKEARAAAEEARRENRELLMKFMDVQGKRGGDEARTLKLYDGMFEVLDRVAESRTELMEENARLRAELAESPGHLIDPTTARIVERVLDVIPVLKEAEKKIPESSPPSLAATPAPPAPGPAAGAATRTAQAASPTQAARGPLTWAALFQRYIAWMVRLAQEDRDPGLYADLLLDQLPDEAVGVLRQAISDHGGADGFLELLGRTWPAVAQHREWFAQYLRSLDEALREESVEGEAGREPQPPTSEP